MLRVSKGRLPILNECALRRNVRLNRLIARRPREPLNQRKRLGGQRIWQFSNYRAQPAAAYEGNMTQFPTKFVTIPWEISFPSTVRYTHNYLSTIQFAHEFFSAAKRLPTFVELNLIAFRVRVEIAPLIPFAVMIHLRCAIYNFLKLLFPIPELCHLRRGGRAMRPGSARRLPRGDPVIDCRPPKRLT